MNIVPRFCLFLIIVVSISGIYSCKYSKEPKLFKNDKISLSYPSYLQEASDVYPVPQALFQAKNGYRDVYFIVVDWGNRPGDSEFNTVFDTVLMQLKSNLKEVNPESTDSNFMVNNLKARETRLSGILSQHDMDIRFLFDIMVVQAPDGHIYQTAGWLMRHKQHIWLKDLQKTAHSFKVVERK